MNGVEWLAQYGTVIAAIPAAISVLAGVGQFVYIRHAENRERTFETYHRLIKELVQPCDNEAIFVDRQIAVVFELQRFKKYREPSILILEGLLSNWQDRADDRLLKQLRTTIASLKDN